MTAVVRLEQSRTLEDLKGVAPALIERLGTGDGELQRLFVDWFRQAAERLAPPDEALPVVRTLGDLKMTWVDRVGEWPKQWMREGVGQGLAQGLAQQRALLRRLAALRFGEETAGRVAEALEQVADAERLAEAGESIVQSATSEELIMRVTRLVRDGQAP